MTRPRPYLLTALLIVAALLSRPLWDAAQAHQIPAQTAEASSRQSVGARDLAVTQFKEFRRGYQSYDGVTDTYLYNEPSPLPRGTEHMFHVKESSGKRGLIRYDLTAIPPGSEIVEARLELYLGYLYPEQAAQVRLYHLLKAWSESEATWATTGLGQGWHSPGAGSSGHDYEADPIVVASISAGNGYKSIDVTGAVQRWVDDPAGNHGALIWGSNIETRFWASDDPREGERPRLLVTYESAGGPTPTSTRSATPTWTASTPPAITPTPASVVYSVSWAEAFDPGYPHCIEAGPITSNPDNTDDILLVWQGVPTSASLSFRYSGNNRFRHSVLLNDVIIGQLDGDNWSSVCTGGNTQELSAPPELVKSGQNKVSILDDGGAETSSWSLQQPRIKLGGIVQATQIVSVALKSSYDGTDQRAMIQTPIGYSSGAGAPNLPLVIALHGWGGRDFNALMWMAQAASDRGWLLAAPDTRGDNQHTASKAVQRDILDLVNHMVASPEYKVDEERIYLVGTSMGGMMAATTAAKYPDRFAALAELKGPTRLDAWYYEIEAWRQNVIANELNGSPSTNPFAYQRASAGAMPYNLRNVPTLIVHGTSDALVPYHHASDLYAALEPYGNVQLHPYDGGHNDNHPLWDPAAILNFLGQHTLNRLPSKVTIRTDEQKSYYWLGVSYNVSDHWTWVDAEYDALSQVITVDVKDERTTPTPINLTFDLMALGLPTGVAYTVEDMNVDTGGFSQYEVATGLTTLTIEIPRDHRWLTIYPHSAPPPNQLLLRQGEQGYTGVEDTYIEENPAGDNHALDDPLRLSVSGGRVPLMRFDLGRVPPNAVIKAAQLRLYAGSKWRTGDRINASIYRLKQDWKVDEVDWNERQDNVPWGAPGASALGDDYDGNAYASQWIENAATWYQYNVTELIKDWRGSYDNLGLALRGENGSGTFTISSSESPGTKPELLIYYSYPTVTPTPSRTPTRTATATPQQERLFLPCVLK